MKLCTKFERSRTIRGCLLLHFQTRRLKVEWCWKRRQILHFWPSSLVKIRGEVGEISGLINKDK